MWRLLPRAWRVKCLNMEVSNSDLNGQRKQVWRHLAAPISYRMWRVDYWIPIAGIVGWRLGTKMMRQ